MNEVMGNSLFFGVMISVAAYEVGVLLKILLVMCILVSIYNCVVWIQAIFFESYYVNVEVVK